MKNRVLFVTGSDAAQYVLAKDCIRSIRQHACHVDHDIAFLDLGCTAEQTEELRSFGCIVRPVTWEFGINNTIPQIECQKGQFCRPFLPEYFPDYGIFFWIDADAWVQDRSAIDLFLTAAQSRGAGVVPEIERSSKFFHGGLDIYMRNMSTAHRRLFGTQSNASLAHHVSINAGIFCFDRNSHLWSIWKRSVLETLRVFIGRAPSADEITIAFGSIVQIALNIAIRQSGLEKAIEFLPLTCNWTCHLAMPAFDVQRSLLVEPYLPHSPIGIIHLTNPWDGGMSELPHAHERRSRRRPAANVGGKEFYRKCRLETTDGGSVVGSLFLDGSNTFLRCKSIDPKKGSQATHEADSAKTLTYDYVSPALQTVWPDVAFPHMVEGNPAECACPYFRKESPHRLYVDRRCPTVGFVSRDEAAILHSTAMIFHGKRGLEIGCWQGWSACHIAAAGVQLDIIDPVLENPDFRPSIEASLSRAGVIGNVRLHSVSSPSAVAALAAENGEPWSFFFIDGDQEGVAVLNDTIACVEHAAADCILLFHDLASPDVARGVQWLQTNGWKTRIYHTSQIMAAAWRGNVVPPVHAADPTLLRRLGIPTHVADLEQPDRRSFTSSEESSIGIARPQMRVSVVLPVYNADETLVRALESICFQEPPPDDVLILDDCSTDRSPEIIAGFTKLYPFVRVHRYASKSTDWLEAYCKQIFSVKGDFIAGLGADDAFRPGFVKAIHEVLELDHQVGVIFCDYAQVELSRNGERDIYVSTAGFTDTKILSPAAVTQRTLNCRAHDCGVASAIRSDLLRKLIDLGFWKMGPWSDSWGYAAMACMFGAAYVPRVLGGFTVRQPKMSYHQRALADPDTKARYLDACMAFGNQEFFASLPRDLWSALALRWGLKTS